MDVQLKPENLILGPRPGRKSVSRLADLKPSHCCTLLSEREGAPGVKTLCQSIGCEWIWLPIEGGSLEALSRLDLHDRLDALSAQIRRAERPLVYLHCSAGIHRTGFFAYAILRAGGMSAGDALAALHELRRVTAEQVGENRIALAETMLAERL
jgi:hypothetical protein